MTTFKLFPPCGDCRRVTFDTVPDINSINELVDEIVQAPADQRRLIYVDSEGDRVAIKTSRDVEEALRDACASRVKTVKIYVQVRPGGSKRARSRCGTPPSSSTTTTTGSPQHGARRECGGWRQRWGAEAGRGGRCGQFVHPNVFSSEWEKDLTDVLEAIFPGVFAPAHSRSSSESASQDEPAPASTKKANEEKDESREDAKDEDNHQPASTDDAHEADVHHTDANEDHDEGEAHGSAPKSNSEEENGAPEVTLASVVETSQRETKADAEQSEQQSINKSNKASSVTDLNSKVVLLREMGFEIPKEVARNMITEMGGRMDLIVRALVANTK